MVELIDEQEEQEAYKDPNAVIMPPPAYEAMFDAGGFTINCQTSRWNIWTKRSDQVDRMCSIAERLFDEILPHTPVSAFIFHFHYIFSLGKGHAAKLLGKLVGDVPLDFGVTEPTAGEMTIEEKSGNADVSIAIRPGSGKSEIHIAFTVEHYIKKKKGRGTQFFKTTDVFEGGIPGEVGRRLSESTSRSEHIFGKLKDMEQ